jgi:hypothetical protein
MTEAAAREFEEVRWRMVVECSADKDLKALVEAIEGDDAPTDWKGQMALDEWKSRTGLKALRKAGPTVVEPEVVIEKDYDGYFEKAVRSWVAEKVEHGEKFLHSTIVVNSGPYRSCAVDCTSDGVSKLTLDFYSAVRNGFGGLSRRDVVCIKEMWL